MTCSDLSEQLDDFPEDFLKMKVLPELLKAVEFGGGGPKALEVVMKIAGGLPSDEFESRVTPVVVRLFGNPDRALRVSLLDGLPLIIERLSQKVVNDKIFPQLVRPVPYLSYCRALITIDILTQCPGHRVHRHGPPRPGTNPEIHPHHR